MQISTKKHRRFMDLSSAIAQTVLAPTTGDTPESLQGTLPIQAGVLKSITHQFISYKVMLSPASSHINNCQQTININLSIIF